MERHALTAPAYSGIEMDTSDCLSRLVEPLLSRICTTALTSGLDSHGGPLRAIHCRESDMPSSASLDSAGWKSVSQTSAPLITHRCVASMPAGNSRPSDVCTRT